MIPELLRPRPAPRRTADELLPSEVHRLQRGDCALRVGCLTQAAREGWRGFECGGCDAYQAPDREAELVRIARSRGDSDAAWPGAHGDGGGARRGRLADARAEGAAPPFNPSTRRRP